MSVDDTIVRIPKELVKLSGISEDELESHNIEIWVNELYGEGKISLSKAAELLNIKADEFIAEFRKKRLRRIGGPQSVQEAIDDVSNLDEALRNRN